MRRAKRIGDGLRIDDASAKLVQGNVVQLALYAVYRAPSWLDAGFLNRAVV